MCLRRGKPRWLTAGSTALLASSALMLSALATAAPAGAAVGGAHGKPLPYRIFAPYFAMWDLGGGGLAAQSQAAGTTYLSLAFLQTPAAGSCTADWNGDPSEPISQSTFGADIAAIQAQGGDVIPSFGGYSADTTDTDLADSCTDVQAIAGVYESLITTYGISRIDLDVEADSLNDTAGINRRNQAIALTERWAAWHHRQIQFSYTIPSNPTGLTASGLAVLQSAIASGAQISTVNAMTFDYYFGTQQDMLADTESAGSALVTQLQGLYPWLSQRQLWHMVGITEMPGIDDFGADETFATTDAAPLLQWADQQGIGFLSFWDLQRDNGGCPGTKGASDCSGVAQPTWFFSHTWEPFTGYSRWGSDSSQE